MHLHPPLGLLPWANTIYFQRKEIWLSPPSQCSVVALPQAG